MSDRATIRINMNNQCFEYGVCGRPFASVREAKARLRAIREFNHGSPAWAKIEHRTADGGWYGERV